MKTKSKKNKASNQAQKCEVKKKVDCSFDPFKNVYIEL